MADSQKGFLPEDLIICDEAHHMTYQSKNKCKEKFISKFTRKI
ncbi:hypothetical protein [Candidatus Phytoplasma sp. AldY-WA1]|nr:hypothetical protein [Candidatus Phytoplasma sp. AldY-WA1]